MMNTQTTLQRESAPTHNSIGVLVWIAQTLSARTAPIAAFAVFCVFQAATFAQENPPPRPPKVTEAPTAPKVMMYLVVVLLVAGVVFASTMKVKRGHQD